MFTYAKDPDVRSNNNEIRGWWPLLTEVDGSAVLAIVLLFVTSDPTGILYGIEGFHSP